MTRRLRLIAVLAGVLAAAATGAGIAWAAFVATTTNSGNSFQAASCFPLHRMATGTYTGDGTDGRAMATGFQPNLVIVKADNAEIAVARTSSMSGDASKPMTGATALSTNRIESLTATGFTLGTDNQVNRSGRDYQWIAMRAGCAMSVGSYVGNGAASRTISGTGFQPELVLVIPAAATQASHRFAGMTRSFPFSSGTGTTTGITGMAANGFTVGNSAETNTNGATYHYIAFNDVSGSSLAGTYTGTNVDNRNIGGVGFQPDYVVIRANDTVTARAGHHRPAALAGTASKFWHNAANSTNGIQALQATGFQVGTDASVNALGPTYHYMAFRNTG